MQLEKVSKLEQIGLAKPSGQGVTIPVRTGKGTWLVTRLYLIQATAQQVSDAIYSAFGIDATVVDEDLVRIAGTGQYKAKVGQKITGDKSIYREVLTNATEYIVPDVKKSQECQRCDKFSICPTQAQLCCPILSGKEVIGVLALIAFTPAQRREIEIKGQQLMNFIRKMADLMSSKVAEQESVKRLILLKKQMETVINFIAEGVVAVDQTGTIISINFTAEKMLHVRAGDILGFPINEVLPGTPVTEVLRNGAGFIDREISIWHNGRHHHYLFSAKPMTVEGVVQGVVASFRSANLPGRYTVTGTSRVTLDDICGSSKSIMAAKAEVRTASESMATVLIMGESGTGKEVFARAIHFEGERAAQPFVAVNCAAIPDNLIESELFGYDEGSFTGARKGGKPGKFEMANGGTLFLDEIGDMPLALQAKLLRVLQEKVIDRLGATRRVALDIRIIAATNRDLEEMVKQGKFREDLYYRLSVFPILLPPLRDRREDIPELAAYFCRKHAGFYGKKVKALAPSAEKVLLAYHWPGNIRELENALERAVIRMNGDVVQAEDLPTKVVIHKQPDAGSDEYTAIKQALEQFGTSVEGKKQAAEALGIGIATLYRKIRKYNL